MRYLSTLHTTRLKRTITTTIATFALILAPFSSIPVHATTSDHLTVNQSLMSGESLTSTSGDYMLILQLDGNLVQYNAADQPIWQTGVLDPAANRLTFQADGNLVLYNAGNRPVWSSRFPFESPGKFVLQDDGNFVAYDTDDQFEWEKFSADRLIHGIALRKGEVVTSNIGHSLTFQHDGNVVLRSPSRQPLWSTRTSGSSADRFVVQYDGNVVLYAASGKTLWQSGTRFPNPPVCNQDGCAFPNTLTILQRDGRLVIYNYNNGTHVIWHT